MLITANTVTPTLSQKVPTTINCAPDIDRLLPQHRNWQTNINAGFAEQGRLWQGDTIRKAAGGTDLSNSSSRGI